MGYRGEDGGGEHTRDDGWVRGDGCKGWTSPLGLRLEAGGNPAVVVTSSKVVALFAVFHSINDVVVASQVFLSPTSCSSRNDLVHDHPRLDHRIIHSS
jgi:hypothetical protein